MATSTSRSLRFVIAYVVPLLAPPHFSYIPVERHFQGDDQGQDVPSLNHIWSIEGIQHHASVRVRSHRQPPWIKETTVHLEIFFVCNLDDALPQNRGIADLHTVPPIRAEFVVIRRTDENVLHTRDIRIIDSRKIDVALTKLVRIILGIPLDAPMRRMDWIIR